MVVTSSCYPAGAAATRAPLPDQATQRGEVRTAHKLQKLLVKSWYARLLAVRLDPAGVSGVLALPNAYL